LPFQALLQTMTALNEIHSTLLELAEQKKQVLIHNQVEQLTQIVSAESRLLKRIGELDEERIRVIGEFMMDKGYKPNPKVTVSDLTKIIFNPEEKKQLLDQQRNLMGTIRKLREINQLNQQLIEHSLHFIDYSLDLLVGPPEDEAVYQNPQLQQRGMKRQGLFDTKA
jgi:flagellar biosynthesis/type III secretory pathway chaperone